MNYKATLHEARLELVQKAIDACNGNKTEAAEALGITRPTLYTVLARAARKQRRVHAEHEEN